jgi:hypothetical protein
MTETSALPLVLEAGGHEFGMACLRLLSVAAAPGG